MNRSPEDRPKVSVLLTAYRRTEYLREALESALAQTLAPFEILVVDDSDSSEIAAIVAAIADPRVRYRPNPSTLGVAVSLREALPECRGTYVAVLNDDDAWEPTFLECLVAPLEADPGRDFAFCDFWAMDAGGTVDRPKSEEFSRTWGRADLPAGDVARLDEFALVEMGVPIAMAAVLRRLAIDPRELVPEVSGAYDFWIACLLAAGKRRGFFVKERLTRYRLHPAMESDRRAADKNENLVYIYRELLRRDAFPAYRLLLRQRLAIAHHLVANDLRDHRRAVAALRRRLESLRLQPAIAVGRLRRLVRRRQGT